MTYSNPGDVVLDFTMGCGSTGVSAKLTGRDFIGIELEEEYYNTAKKRIGMVDENIVVPAASQLTTQLHKEMRTVPEHKYETKFNETIDKRKK
jgi:DNA modification methylase